ncbi:MAG: ATP-binding cassette domain-containing protein [Chloroflexota bacterium]|nr:MAG: ATP-binding cassette domain-containing protein [Chloroflexota bacterium]
MIDHIADTVGGAAVAEDVLLDVRRLRKFFPIRRGMLRKLVGHVRAVDDVSFVVRRGETLALVGESGCGKTTTSRCILRAIDPTSGEIHFRTVSGEVVDVGTVPRGRLRPLRREMQMIFQDPFSSLNPRMTLLDIVGEPLLVNGVGNRREREDRVADLLRLVGLRPEFLRRYPHAFSGGQRQRIGIARALALNPRLIVADEPVSALDVSVQAQILNLMLELQENLGLTYLFVAHDLSVVKHISDRVAVMYVGQMVELTENRRIFATPRHPYTEALLSSIPEPDPRLRPRRGGSTDGAEAGHSGRVILPGEIPSPDSQDYLRPQRYRDRIVLQGEVANPAAPPSGCYFHPRCQYAKVVCKTEAPIWEQIEAGHWVRCHRARELTLKGVTAPTP